MTTDYAAQARSYSATAAAATRRARKDAAFSADQYESAAHNSWRASAMTKRPMNSRSLELAAHYESQARSDTRVGDTYLRASFHADGLAEFYRGLAARYREMAARQAS
jgi:hypothetical protein